VLGCYPWEWISNLIFAYLISANFIFGVLVGSFVVVCYE
jgi:hypothetical protein